MVIYVKNIVEVRDINKVYKLYDKPSDRLKEAVFSKSKKKHSMEFYALDGVSFGIKKGEAVGIIGKNGSGKSTLLKILAGVVTPTKGEVVVDGRVSALLELGAGFNPEYTGIENIYLNGTIMGIPQEKIKENIDTIVEFADIGDFINQPVKTYSSGMFVRLAFAVAINVDPDVLIVDEALAVGDYRFQSKCYAKFDELKNMGKTILFVTHDVDAVRRFCTRAIWINEGKLILDADVNTVTSKYMEFITNGEVIRPENNPDRTRVTENVEEEPINRFGMKVGTIKSADLYDENGEVKHCFEIGEEVVLKMTADIPEDADLDNVGLAVSMKDKRGLDLFVICSFDKDMKFEKTGETHIEVRFKNYLNCGEYSLSVAIEDRSTHPIGYYDYIEGAVYVKVMTDREYFGLMQIPGEIKITQE
ncbi:MAG: ABC transporter ATP-binding protein [Clostridia bacterium]|nr:ABC transporter ATP-binding protein [Clostridia bacterium]